MPKADFEPVAQSTSRLNWQILKTKKKKKKKKKKQAKLMFMIDFNNTPTGFIVYSCLNFVCCFLSIFF